MSGFTQWGWPFTQLLWIREALRGQGAPATRRGRSAAPRLQGCVIDTFSPHAKHAYERQGYTVFGEIPDFVAGCSRFFLQKRLS